MYASSFSVCLHDAVYFRIPFTDCSLSASCTAIMCYLLQCQLCHFIHHLCIPYIAYVRAVVCRSLTFPRNILHLRPKSQIFRLPRFSVLSGNSYLDHSLAPGRNACMSVPKPTCMYRRQCSLCKDAERTASAQRGHTPQILLLKKPAINRYKF